MIAYRYATKADLEAFWGKPCKGTIRALVWTLDGEVAGVIGIVREKSGSKFFSDVPKAFLPHLKSFKARRAIIEVMRWVKASPSLVCAVAADGDGYDGHKVLTSLGFTHVDAEHYLWVG